MWALLRRYLRLALWILLAALTLLYASSYIGEGLSWYDSGRELALVACHGKVMFLDWSNGHTLDALTMARDFAKRWDIFFHTSCEMVIIPVLPILGLSVLLVLLLTGLRRRWRWWKEPVPAIPLLFVALALNGTVLRENAERHTWSLQYDASTAQQHTADLFRQTATLIEAIGYVGFVPVALSWAIPLRRNIRESRRRFRIAAGHCLKCDYDLTANASGICPECGEPIPQGVSMEE